MDVSVLEYFQKVATRWDNLRADYFDESVIIKALEHAPLTRDQTAVDAGTGTGFVAAGLAPFASRVIGIDFSDAMLDVARENMSRLGVSNVEFRRGDLEHLPLEDATADAVYANMALHHARNPQAALREMARVCKPGGRIVITDATHHHYAWFREEMADVWLGFTPEEMETWLTTLGLTKFRYDLVGTQ